MPDTEIEQMAGDGLEPTPQFVASLRDQLRGEWRDDAAVVAPTRLFRWRVAAGFVAAAAAVVGIGLLVTRHDDTDSIVGVDSTTSSTSPSYWPPGTPAEGLPPSPPPQLWVVTSVDGAAIAGPDMPTFTPQGDGAIIGWDGCNQYERTSEGGGGTTAGCPIGVTPVVATGPFVADAQGTARTDRLTVSPFSVPRSLAEPVSSLFRTFVFGDAERFALTADGLVLLESHGCEIATDVRWAIGDQNFLMFDFTSIPDCYALDPTFVTWLEQMRDTGAEFALRADPALGMWTRNGDRVTRLAFAEEVIQG